VSAAETAAAEDRIDLGTWMTLAALMLATVLEVLDTTIVNVALPHVMGHLGATLDEISWVVSGYIVSNVMIIPMTGWLQSRFGRKRYLTASVLLFTTASALCGASSSLGELVVFRVLQGIGGGALLSTSQAVIVETFPARRQALGQSIFGLGVMVGPSLGPTLGGWITDAYSWRWIFYVNVPLGALAALLCAVYLKDPPHLSERKAVSPVDYVGIALLIAGIGALQTTLERGQALGWFDSPTIVLLGAVSVVCLSWFVVHELRTAHPVVDLRALRHSNLALGCIAGAVVGASLYGAMFLFPVYSQSLLGWTASQSGMAILPSSLAMAFAMVAVTRFAARFGPQPFLIAGMCIFLGAMLYMMRWTHESGVDDILGPQIARGLGLGLMFVPLSMVALRSLPVSEVANAAGLYNLSRQLGGSFGVALLSTLVERQAKVHRSYLGEHVSALEPAGWERLTALQNMFLLRGADPDSALQAARAGLEHTLQTQALVLAFADAYLAILVMGLLALPLLAFTGRGMRQALARRAELEAHA
jgi:MFS transporter, DHA2 family, multidrug resistance protein